MTALSSSQYICFYTQITVFICCIFMPKYQRHLSAEEQHTLSKTDSSSFYQFLGSLRHAAFQFLYTGNWDTDILSVLTWWCILIFHQLTCDIQGLQKVSKEKYQNWVGFFFFWNTQDKVNHWVHLFFWLIDFTFISRLFLCFCSTFFFFFILFQILPFCNGIFGIFVIHKPCNLKKQLERCKKMKLLQLH